jgi:hypothetical protein
VVEHTAAIQQRAWQTSLEVRRKTRPHSLYGVRVRGRGKSGGYIVSTLNRRRQVCPPRLQAAPRLGNESKSLGWGHGGFLTVHLGDEVVNDLRPQREHSTGVLSGTPQRESCRALRDLNPRTAGGQRGETEGLTRVILAWARNVATTKPGWNAYPASATGQLEGSTKYGAHASSSSWKDGMRDGSWPRRGGNAGSRPKAREMVLERSAATNQPALAGVPGS